MRIENEAMGGLEQGSIVDGRYRIERLLGVGGMGQVFIARHLRLGRAFALKTLKNGKSDGAVDVSRLEREARVAGAVVHDNICEVIDTGVVGAGVPYLVMPLLRGITLSEAIAADAPFTVARSVNIAVQILEGLAAAHAAHVVHRDLKPGNVFLTKIGRQDDFIKILDFGISKRIDNTESQLLTRSGAVMGTPLYMSPEQACGASKIDHRADIYAVGLLLYEMLTGVKPFDGKSYNEIITRIVGAPFKSPMLLNSAVSNALDHIVLKAMSRNPSDRFSTAEEMAGALGNLREGEESRSLAFERTRRSVPGDLPNTALIDYDSFPPIVGFGSKRRPMRRPWVFAVLLVLGIASIGIGAFIFSMGTDTRSASGEGAPPAVPVRPLPASPSENGEGVLRPSGRAGVLLESDSVTGDNQKVPSHGADAPSSVAQPPSPSATGRAPAATRKETASETDGPRRRGKPKPVRRSAPEATAPTVFNGKKDTLFSDDYGE